MSKVYLIEPEPAQREWCRMHLTTDGFSVAAFDDARRALQAIRADLPDLVILATNMLGMSAFAFAAALRSNVRSSLVPIMFLVPAKDTQALVQALEIEPDGVVSKPLTREVLLDAVTSRISRGAGALAAPHLATGAASGPLLEEKQASVLVVVVRNFVSLARGLSASVLDRLLSQFATQATQAIFDNGGWIVRGDAMSMVALFEDVPDQAVAPASRAIEAALGAVLAGPRVKRWAHAALADRASVDVSVGCGVHSGPVIVARLAGAGRIAPCIAGQTADLAHRLEGRAKGLQWALACSEAALLQAGVRFEIGRRSSLTDRDHNVTVPIVEVIGYKPATALPGELARMGEVREAVVANTLLASLAGDIDREAANHTIMVRRADVAVDPLPMIPDRRIERRVGRSTPAEAYLGVHLPTGRQELLKVVRVSVGSPAFARAYGEEYRKLLEVEQRNIAAVYDVGQTSEAVYVALEFIAGESLGEAMRRSVPVGLAINVVAQACLAVDALHELGIAHGNLDVDDFRFREDGALVLTDFNVTERVGAQFGIPERHAAPSGPARGAASRRADFLALGRIFHALLTGDNHLLRRGPMSTGELYRASRLPVQLTPVQECLDRLLGVGTEAPIDQGQEVLIALLTVREAFAFDLTANPNRIASTPRSGG
jgi:DNA-binding response OmpR family regulator